MVEEIFDIINAKIRGGTDEQALMGTLDGIDSSSTRF